MPVIILLAVGIACCIAATTLALLNPEPGKLRTALAERDVRIEQLTREAAEKDRLATKRQNVMELARKNMAELEARFKHRGASVP